ncbi:MAG: AbrB/MazE/SpoVT family DNA-binding domain-containing protein [Methanocalculus sp.]|uniref:AbrB/MazE/SpoVT family DNA-binding domain-containing protein n=1 Tax=Methanocalculus sp. TaxID=2004547 RepID=UPI002720B618|nr:AbrB/MazE/SpoVT family DNA-binding domain-containing protein [Methanocalculus sp.]MDO8842693.1 AbrB/MazE/SpoVT family DNA-binding domain-containing protein [Methanocalculus sp.]MDO9538564.1 AbrB/MazE/SpoVT family DNA-binding domain-containing protein [Methanocalculus sp.]
MFHRHNCNHSHTDEKKHIFGTVKVGDRGQIVIPKDARELFDIKPGDTLMVLGDEDRGIAIVKADKFRKMALSMLQMFENTPEEPPED